MKTKTKATDFLRAMASDPEDTPQIQAASPAIAGSREKDKPEATATSRAGRKHFGGYLDEVTLEKIALLRVRLKKDNSELIKLAIDELHTRHMAKRAHGDA